MSVKITGYYKLPNEFEPQLIEYFLYAQVYKI